MTLTYGHDAVGNRTSLADSLGGVNSYTYDSRNELTTIVQSGTGVASKRVDMAYDNGGRETALTRYSDLTGTTKVAVTAYAYDVADRLTTLTHQTSGGSTISSYAYTLDAADRLTSEARTWGTSSDTVGYSYTNDNQLTGVTHTNGSFANESFGFDANGNRNTTGYSTGTGNELSADGTYTYTYDAEGDLTSRTTVATGTQTTYTYDYRNRLTEVDQTISGVHSVVAQYTYDALNRPIKVVEGGATRYTLYDGQTPLLDFNGSGTVTARYLSDPRAVDAVLARETTGGVVAWYIVDRLGTVRDIVNNSGAVIDHVDYTAYGTATDSAPSAGDRFKYAGMELDAATKLYYDRARWYDAGSGRFVEEDPSGFGGGDADLFRYAGNGPTDGIDPSGLADFYLGGQGYNWPTSLVPSWGAFTNTMGSWGQTAVVTLAGAAGEGTTAAYSGTATGGVVGLVGGPTTILPAMGAGFAGGGSLGFFDGGLNALFASPPGTTAGQALRSGYDRGWVVGPFGAIGPGYMAAKTAKTAAAELEAAARAASICSPKAPSSATIRFGNNPNQKYHTFRHVVEAGMDQGVVQAACQADLAANSAAINAGLNIRALTVNGQQITYHAYKMSDGLINVGRITLP